MIDRSSNGQTERGKEGGGGRGKKGEKEREKQTKTAKKIGRQSDTQRQTEIETHN